MTNSNVCPTCGSRTAAPLAVIGIGICRNSFHQLPNEPDKSKCPACSHDWKQHIEGICHDNPLCECPLYRPTPDSGTELDISGSTKYFLPKWLAEILASEKRLGDDKMARELGDLLRQAEENGRKQWLEHELGRGKK